MTARSAMGVLSRYGVLILIGVLFGIVLVTSRWNSAARKSDPHQFEGCYVGLGIPALRLAPSGQLINSRGRVGSYHIVAPVGGKHGYLVETSGLNIKSQKASVTIMPGEGGFLWPITPSGELTVTFAPDGEYQLHRQPSCS